jgi:Nucleotidyl transferase AbiEii toxin, Type IV TA system
LTVSVVFEKLRAALDAVGIPYFVTGSFASSAHGIPRSTNDIDIVISASRQQLEQLLARLSQTEFETELDDPFDAFVRKSMFNIVDAATLWKVDLIFKQPTPFDASRFSRRNVVDIAGVHLYTASPEDILITKLWWAKLGESQRQINDCVGIIQVQRESLDLEYISRWVAALELQEQWATARERAG